MTTTPALIAAAAAAITTTTSSSAAATTTLTPGGWVSMIVSVGLVTTLFIWCLARVLRGDNKKR